MTNNSPTNPQSTLVTIVVAVSGGVAVLVLWAIPPYWNIPAALLAVLATTGVAVLIIPMLPANLTAGLLEPEPPPSELTSDSYVSQNPQSITWQWNALLVDAIREHGLSGAEFRLESYKTSPAGGLLLVFHSLQPIPADKRRYAGVIVRSVVALTLPRVVATIAGYRLVNSGSTYTITLGNGVQLPFYELHGQSATLQRLQVGGDWLGADDLLLVISPSVGAAVPSRAMAAPGKYQAVLEKVGTAFVAQWGGRVLSF